MTPIFSLFGNLVSIGRILPELTPMQFPSTQEALKFYEFCRKGQILV